MIDQQMGKVYLLPPQIVLATLTVLLLVPIWTQIQTSQLF